MEWDTGAHFAPERQRSIPIRPAKNVSFHCGISKRISSFGGGWGGATKNDAYAVTNPSAENDMKIVRRGYLPDYEKMFREEAMPKLQEAVTDALFLLNRGHSLKRAVHIAMEHYQLSDAQRIAMTRGLVSNLEIKHRRQTQRSKSDIEQKTVYLDGFNAIILMESLVSLSPVFRCMDHAIRDLANLKGSYHIIDKTESAIRLILAQLAQCHVQKLIIHIDNPVSNSRNLKKLILKLAQDYPFQTEVHLIDACDKSFNQKDYVISGDGIVIDHAQSWIPLYLWIVEDYAQNYPVWLIDFDKLATQYRNIVNDH